MRFRIEGGWKCTTGACQICWQEMVLPVRYHTQFGLGITHSGVRWIWPDGVEYRLMCPTSFRIGQTPEWYISSKDGVNVTGRLTHLPLRKTILRLSSLGIEWDLDGTIIAENARDCRTKELRVRGGRRLALWRFYNFCPRGIRQGLWVEGVWRNGLPERAVPAIAGMILATLGVPSGNP